MSFNDPPWLHCNACMMFANTNPLYILECTHVLCIACISNPKADSLVCPVCSTQCAFRRISSDDLSQEMLVFFSDHLLLSEIDRLRYITQFQISNQNAAISHLREKISRQTKLLREARNYIEQLQSGHVEPIGGNRASLKFGHPNVSPAAAAPVWDFAADRPTQNRQPSSAMTAMKTTIVPSAPQRIARVRPPEFSNLANHMVSQSPRPLLYPRHIGTDSNTHHATTFPGSNRHRSASRIRASSYMSSAASSALPTPRSSYGLGFSKTNPFYSNNPQQPFGPR